MRRFVRHPTDIPIAVVPIQSGQGPGPLCKMSDIGQGGFCCEIENYLEVGTEVHIDIPSISPEYHGRGEVVWCLEKRDCFEVGVSFTDVQEAYRSRMVQQVCQIEHYKNIVFEREGRVLDGNEAAAEWIKKHAEDFSQVSDYR